jgi:hypothetical protein
VKHTKYVPGGVLTYEEWIPDVGRPVRRNGWLGLRPLDNDELRTLVTVDALLAGVREEDPARR